MAHYGFSDLIIRFLLQFGEDAGTLNTVIHPVGPRTERALQQQQQQLPQVRSPTGLWMADGHASPLKRECEGSVCLSGCITLD